MPGATPNRGIPRQFAGAGQSIQMIVGADGADVAAITRPTGPEAVHGSTTAGIDLLGGDAGQALLPN